MARRGNYKLEKIQRLGRGCKGSFLLEDLELGFYAGVLEAQPRVSFLPPLPPPIWGFFMSRSQGSLNLCRPGTV